jgi:hypothetical protein
MDTIGGGATMGAAMDKIGGGATTALQGAGGATPAHENPLPAAPSGFSRPLVPSIRIHLEVLWRTLPGGAIVPLGIPCAGAQRCARVCWRNARVRSQARPAASA